MVGDINVMCSPNQMNEYVWPSADVRLSCRVADGGQIAQTAARDEIDGGVRILGIMRLYVVLYVVHRKKGWAREACPA